MPFFICSKILGESDKQEILQQMFRKFEVSNRLPGIFRKLSTKLDKEEQNMKWKKEIFLELRAYFCELTCKTDRAMAL